MKTSHDLATLPEGAELRSVVATPTTLDGRQVLRVSLTDEVTLDGRPGVDYVDQPTFVVLPVMFENGTIEVDVRSGLNELAPDDARGFAGLAYRISEGRDQFEAVYCVRSTADCSSRRALASAARSSTSPTPSGPSTGCVPNVRTGRASRAPTSSPARG